MLGNTERLWDTESKIITFNKLPATGGEILRKVWNNYASYESNEL